MSYNNLLIDELKVPLFPDTILINPPDLTSPSNEIISLTAEVERLNINIHTQSLCVDIEKVKRQKLRATLKRVKRDVISIHQVLTHLRSGKR